ncbi:MAG TPA: PaaI family thioesterase [Hymenobacter sp.]
MAVSETAPFARSAPEMATMVAAYNRLNHYGRANGMELTVPAPGQAEYLMTIVEAHLSSPNTCHGGVLAGLMDAALGAAALSLAFTTLEFVSTVEFKMNYFHAVHLHDVLVAKGTVDHAGNKLIVSSCVIYRLVPGQEDVAVARGLGTFNRYPADKRDFAKLVLQETTRP